MIHDTQVFITPKSYSVPFRAWYGLMWPLLASRASKLLTVSQYAKACIVEANIAPSEKIAVIHNGVDHVLSILPETSIVEKLVLTDRPYFVGLANTQAHKNIGVILKAFEDARLKDARLVLIGGATKEDFLQIGASIPENIVFAGRVTDGQMRALIEGAIAFAFPSRTEGFGLPPLEAMTLGVPAVVAPCGALPELCGSSAIYADADVSEAWANAFERLIEDGDLRRRYSMQGLERAKNFTWASAAAKLANILHQV